jgi:RHS repeat-associated protein
MPVDIASGSVRLEFDDIVIPGKVDLVWNRLYTTKLVESSGKAMGRGWTSKYDATLTKVPAGYLYRTADGDLELFEDPAHAVDRGAKVQRLGTYEEIFRLDQRYVVQSWDVETGDIQRFCFLVDHAEQPMRLSSLEDVTGQALDLIWDLQGRLAEIRQRLEKRALALAYSPSGQISSISLRTPNGEQHQLIRYEYNTNGHLIAVYDAANFADRYEYDAQGRVHREIVKDGGVFLYRYDQKGRCVKTTGLNHYAEKRLRYFDAIGFTEVTDSFGRTFRYQHLQSGQMVREIDPLGNEKSTDYDKYGRIIAKTDATGAKTHYAYDNAGNRSSVTDALGNTTLFSYNNHHLPLTMTDALGQVWHRAYDSANRMIATMDPLQNRWYIRYDQEGNVAEIINPLGAKKFQKYEQGILKAVTDWLGHITYFQLDGFGRVAQRKGALGEITHFRYDLLGNPIQVTLPDSATLHASYDNVGNLTRFIDANGNTTLFRYGPCQRLLERIDPVGGVVRYVWGNEPGRLEQVINEKSETYNFFRDEAGRIIREQSFDGAERHFKYDAEGYAVTYINANGETINLQRDALHRVIGQTLPDGEQVSYGFDPIGNLLSAVNADIPVSFERDPLGRIVKEIQGEHWVESGYDALGNLIHTATSLGHTVDYKVDANGFVSELTTLGDQTLEFKRNAYGQETQRQMPGGMVMEQRYDDLGRLIEQRVGPGRLGNGDASVIPQKHEIIRRNYSYDRNSSLTSIVDGRWGRVDYVYDPAERLLQAILEQGPSEAFAYDATGNITRMQAQEKEGGTEETLVYGTGNRLLQKGRTRYEYNPEGHLIRRIDDFDNNGTIVWLYEWDALDRLKSIKRPDGELWNYKYDALGRRIKKVAPQKSSSKTTQFVWDQHLIINEGAEQQSAFIYDDSSFKPLLLIRNSKIYTIINDNIGTPQEMLDNNGKFVWNRNVNVWGNKSDRDRSSGLVNCEIQFQGQWEDLESGLFYNRFRYYDPSVGRYISSDPIGIAGGLNAYSYSKNPINWIDPFGLVDETEPGYHVYGLYENQNATKPYYIGITDDPTRRRAEHADSGRLPEGAVLKPIHSDVTYGEARGFEQALIDHHETKTAAVGSDLKKAKNFEQRGNKINSYDKNSTTRDKDRQKYFEKARKKEKARLKQTCSG